MKQLNDVESIDSVVRSFHINLDHNCVVVELCDSITCKNLALDDLTVFQVFMIVNLAFSAVLTFSLVNSHLAVSNSSLLCDKVRISISRVRSDS